MVGIRCFCLKSNTDWEMLPEFQGKNLEVVTHSELWDKNMLQLCKNKHLDVPGS